MSIPAFYFVIQTYARVPSYLGQTLASLAKSGVFTHHQAHTYWHTAGYFPGEEWSYV